jgi:lipopolysaccharide/colanic/teichoic acid biosynthesis glycosyltransferase
MTPAIDKLLPGTAEPDLILGAADEASGRVRISGESLLAAALMVLLAPLILLAVVLVRLSSRGPAIYTQPRVGKDGRRFTLYKIRTMYLDSEPRGACWSVPGDQRVTLVGRFLRRSHIDELPQLLNILRGEMSLIGPRPERPEIVARLRRVLPDYLRRLEVRPGLTGMAQVLQPPDQDLAMVRRKLALDLHYIDRGSRWLDLRILTGTALHLVGVPPGRLARLCGFPEDPDVPAVAAAAWAEVVPVD